MTRMNVYFRQQFELAAKCLPIVAEEKCFALKGGTAINLFFWDLPRLSVDIDLVYLPIEARSTSLKQIDQAMQRIEKNVKSVLGCKVKLQRLSGEGTIVKMDVSSPNTTIRIELSPVQRGSVYSSEFLQVKPSVERNHGPIHTTVASVPDVYAGKFIAALDRQNPRDFYDVNHFLKCSRVTEEMRKSFVVYLISHNRATFELLDPIFIELGGKSFESLQEMMIEPATLAELTNARIQLKSILIDDMPDLHKEFLVGFHKGEPDWSLLDIPHVQTLPSVKWKMLNMEKMAPAKRADQLDKIKQALETNT